MNCIIAADHCILAFPLTAHILAFALDGLKPLQLIRLTRGHVIGGIFSVGLHAPYLSMGARVCVSVAHINVIF